MRGWIETLWPLFGGVVLVILAWASFDSRLKAVEAANDREELHVREIDSALRSEITAALGEARGAREKFFDLDKRLDRIQTILEERLPKKEILTPK